MALAAYLTPIGRADTRFTTSKLLKGTPMSGKTTYEIVKPYNTRRSWINEKSISKCTNDGVSMGITHKH